MVTLVCKSPPLLHAQFRRERAWRSDVSTVEQMSQQKRHPKVPLTYQQNSLIRYMSQTDLPQPFGLSLSKPGRSLRAALRQAQGERVYLRYVANQAKLPIALVE